MGNGETRRTRRGLYRGLGLAIGTLGGVAVVGWLMASRRMPGIAGWQRSVATRRGAVEADRLAVRVQRCYDELWAGRPRMVHRGLRLHLEQILLPGLAVYLALRDDGREAALAEVESWLWLAFGQRLTMMRQFGRLPAFFSLFRWVIRGVMHWGFPPEGWEMELLEDSSECYAFDIHRCFYLEVLTAYGAPELTPLYCRTDDWMAEALPPAVRFERAKTLGRGDDRCDFRWRYLGGA